MESDWPGEKYCIELDYVVLKFVDINNDRLKHRLSTSFVGDWDEHLDRRLVSIELKKKYQQLENEKFPALAASTRSSGLTHDYSLKLREEAALAMIGKEEGVAFAEHALCLRLWKDGWDSNVTATSFLIMFECLYKYKKENKDLRSLILTTDNLFELFADGNHEDSQDRCLNLKANAAIAQKDWVLAANAYEKLVRVREMRFGIGSAKASEAYVCLGQVYGKAKKWNESYALLKQGYNSYLSTLGENHKETKLSKKMLADSLLEVGQFSESEMHYLLLPSAFESQTMDGKQNDGKDSSNERDKALIKLYQLLETK